MAIATAEVDVDLIHSALKTAHDQQVLLPVKDRIAQLQALAWSIVQHKQEIQRALFDDLGQHPLEADLTQISPAIWAATDYVDNLPSWSSATSERAKHLAFALYSTSTEPVPRGPALIISPFNYPFKLAIEPLCAAIAAGCPTLVIMSPASPQTAAVLRKVVGEMDKRVVEIIVGGKEEGERATSKSWGRVVFTGSTRVGKEVAVACARTLTPCTLELGGKNPAIIDASADLHIAAKRTLVYKVMNCSQTCTTTDYTLVPPALQGPYIDYCLSLLKAWFPEGELASSSYGTLSRSRIEHLTKLLDETKGTVLRRGVVDLERGKMGISIVADVREGDVLMKEEIFGPILVVVPSENVQASVTLVNKGENPLGIWLFSRDKAAINYVYKHSLSGGIIVGDCAQTALVDTVPFSGVGASGHGCYRGKWGFDLFSHERGSIVVPNWAEPLLSSRYPPYTEVKRFLLQAFLLPLPLPFPHPSTTPLQRVKWWVLFWWRKQRGWKVVGAALVLGFLVQGWRSGSIRVERG